MFPNLRNLLSLIAGLLALAALACPIAPASAGEYDVWSCRGPAGQPLSTEAWAPRSFDASSTDVNFADDCATGGPVALTLNPTTTGPRRPYLGLGCDPPRGGKITGYRLLRGLRAAASMPGYFYKAAISETDGASVHEFGCASALAIPDWQCSIEGSLTDPDDPSNELTATGLSLDRLAVLVACTNTSGCAASPFGYAADVALFGATVTIEDDNPPILADIGGSLAGTGTVYGPAGLFVRATDDNAGVASMSLEIDGQPQQTINISSGACDQPYVRPRPCPADAGRNFEVDTSNLPEGHHIASGTITDAAGNQAPFGPVDFTVEKPSPGYTNGSPAVFQPRLGIDSESIWHRPGQTPEIHGKLTTDTGLPIDGAKLEVQVDQLTSTGNKTVSRPPVTTDPDGGFHLTLPGQGSRKVTVTFAPGVGQSVTASASTLVRSRLKVKLKVMPRKVRIGRATRFRGRLVGAGPTGRAVPVDIQAKVRGRWQTVATVKTKAGGAFAKRYTFKYVQRNALFSFRAVVRGAPGWPWPTVKSPVRKVKIRVGGW